jgi:hypothetical protein
VIPVRVTPGRVLIQPDIETQAVAQTDGGIFLAPTLEAAVDGEDAREAWYSGTVLALPAETPDFDVRPYLRRQLRDLLDCASYPDLLQGVERVLRELDELPQTPERGFTVGDRVTFSASAGEAITIDGTTYLILSDADVLGVLESA